MAAPSTHGGASTAAVLHGVEDIRMEARPVAAPAAGQALIRVHSVGICGSDMHYWRRALSRAVSAAAMLGASADTSALRVA
jgi:threonine dehydrogenase-like Zn-dependent dehydrogenase